MEAKSNVDEKESQSVHKDWERIKIENILKIKNNEKSEKKEEWCYPYPEDDSEIRSTIVKILIAWREAYLLAYFDLIPQKEHEKYGSRCEWTQAIVDKLYAENNHLFGDDFQKLFYRILFYLSLRTIIRNTVILEKREGELLLEAKTELLSPEKRKKWRNAYAKELNVLISKLRELHKLRSREVNNNLDIQENSEENPLLMFLDKYSKSCSISSKFLEKKFKEFKTQPQILKRDALKLKENEYDVIVTDPPYGLNIKEEIEELAKLYSEVIRVMIKSLKDDGQMVLGLPDRSHTGRELPFFTQEDFITRQIIAIADKEGFEVVNLLSEVPRPQEIFQTPYYWESERALRRAILHFRFRRKKTKTKESNL